VRYAPAKKCCEIRCEMSGEMIGIPGKTGEDSRASFPSVHAVFVVFLRSCARGREEFSRLPDSATLAPLRMVDPSLVRVGLGRMRRRWDWLWRQLTLGSVIFQSVFLSLEEPVGWVIERN
jgi:hypothetical protein